VKRLKTLLWDYVGVGDKLLQQRPESADAGGADIMGAAHAPEVELGVTQSGCRRCASWVCTLSLRGSKVSRA